MQTFDSQKANTEILSNKSRYLRRLIFRAIENGGRGHIGPALSLVETIHVLYEYIMRHDPESPKSENRDRFILSKGHGCLALYAVLADQGYFQVDELDSFCHFDSMLGGHPEITTPGIESSTGSLGHGLPIGVGIAISGKIKKANYHTYVLMGDGEINEGSVWEAAAIASKHKLNNLTAIIDYNKIQSAGSVKEIMDMEPLKSKWESFGFNVLECNGHSISELKETFNKEKTDRPTVIIAHTVKGKGIPAAEHNPSWHHKAKLSPEILNEIKEALKG
mgnify:CR=1 FL=1|tara:strand:- start:1984 stop:2814 length:831 start_codon:yes stop_codon:yes gene_type:complete